MDLSQQLCACGTKIAQINKTTNVIQKGRAQLPVSFYMLK
jgi:hypothetical protein